MLASRARIDLVDVRGRPCQKGDDLLCDICRVNQRDVKGFRNSKLLIFPCLHSDRMCAQCVLRLKRDTLEKTYMPHFEVQKEGETIRCPFCRKTCIAPNVVVKVVEEQKVCRGSDAPTEPKEVFRRLGDMEQAKALRAERRIAEKQYDDTRRGVITTAALAGVGAKHRFACSPRGSTASTRAIETRGGASCSTTNSRPTSSSGTRGRVQSYQSSMRRPASTGARLREVGLTSRPDPLRPLPSVIDPNSVPKHMRRAAAALLDDKHQNETSRPHLAGDHNAGSGVASIASAKGAVPGRSLAYAAVFRKPLGVPMLP